MYKRQVLILFLLLGFGFGFLLGGQIKKIQYTEFFKNTDRKLILDLRNIFQPFGRVQSPFIFASLGTALAIGMSLSVNASESLIIRLALSPFIIAVSQVFINWATGSLSPAGIQDGLNEEDAKSLRQKMKFFIFILILSYIFFGPDWLTGAIASEQSLMRIAIVGILIIALSSVLRSVTEVFLMDGQYSILKFLGYSALTISFLAELSGFHNLASFVLSGFMITLFVSYVLWALLTLTEKTRDWINKSTDTFLSLIHI